jgi:hypothetical protein
MIFKLKLFLILFISTIVFGAEDSTVRYTHIINPKGEILATIDLEETTITHAKKPKFTWELVEENAEKNKAACIANIDKNLAELKAMKEKKR